MFETEQGATRFLLGVDDLRDDRRLLAVILLEDQAGARAADLKRPALPPVQVERKNSCVAALQSEPNSPSKICSRFKLGICKDGALKEAIHFGLWTN
jgi:hypothetical protein